MSRITLALFPCTLLFPPAARAQTEADPVPVPRPAPVDLVTEFQTDPLGIDAPRPRLSWQLAFAERGAVQTAYQVQAAGARDALSGGTGLLWDTGRVASDASIDIAYGGPAPASASRCWWRVRAWDGQGRASTWSEPAFFETGLLRPSDWRARWITPDWADDPAKPRPAPMMRKEFRVEKEPASARLYITSLGDYEAAIDGRRVGEDVLTPGWTDFSKRIEYRTYDVTALVRKGPNAIAVTIGDGRYRGTLGFNGRKDTYGAKACLLAELRIVAEDGSVLTVGTDGTWKASTGPILASDYFNGETYDARLERKGWDRPGFDDRGWKPVALAGAPGALLCAAVSPPERRTEEVAPIAILHTPRGETVFDMGQNMVGWVRLKVEGPAGTTVTLRHAEVLDRNGDFYTENLRSALQTDRYILKGGGEEVYEPHFTYHGFRYVEVRGYPGTPTLGSLVGIVVHADLRPTGTWECSNPLLNRLQHNIVWSQKGNFLDVPTDCPQRNERLGWAGDAQVFSRTAAFNFGVDRFFAAWLRDLADDQKPDGAVPVVIPDILTRLVPRGSGAAGWGDAAVVIPWNLYVAYGDRRLLEAQYPSMRAWVDYMHRQAPDLLWNKGVQFGDWLAYASPPAEARSYPGATTGKDLVATAYFARSAGLVARAAAVLGKADDARTFQALSDGISAAFNREFVTPNGRVGENTQTAYAVALRFGLLPEPLRPQAADRLAADVALHRDHLTTGFLGTPCLCRALSDCGKLDAAYALLEQRTYPGWLYPVTRGATTIWERWDGIKPDGTFQDPSMNSFNHYAYGAIGRWLYSVVAGLDADPREPGYKHVVVRPMPGGGLAFARAALETRYGETEAGWKVVGDSLIVSVRVPPNAHATVRLPAATLAAVTESGLSLSAAAGVSRARQQGADVTMEVGAGDYRFEYPSPDLARELSPPAATASGASPR